jgi:hypothetical protein
VTRFAAKLVMHTVSGLFLGRSTRYHVPQRHFPNLVVYLRQLRERVRKHIPTAELELASQPEGVHKLSMHDDIL